MSQIIFELKLNEVGQLSTATLRRHLYGCGQNISGTKTIMSQRLMTVLSGNEAADIRAERHRKQSKRLRENFDMRHRSLDPPPAIWYERMDMLIHYGINLNNFSSYVGARTPLEVAVMSSNIAVVTYTLSHGADVDGRLHMNLPSPLHRAASEFKALWPNLSKLLMMKITKIIRILVDNGANLHATCGGYATGVIQSPLDILGRLAYVLEEIALKSKIEKQRYGLLLFLYQVSFLGDILWPINARLIRCKNAISDVLSNKDLAALIIMF
jgi:hypothetical protein